MVVGLSYLPSIRLLLMFVCLILYARVIFSPDDEHVQRTNAYIDCAVEISVAATVWMRSRPCGATTWVFFGPAEVTTPAHPNTSSGVRPQLSHSYWSVFGSHWNAPPQLQSAIIITPSC